MGDRIELTTQLDCSTDRAFDLSVDVDAHVGSMAASREVAIAGVTTGRMTLGDEVTWRAWHLGIPWTMTSRITEFDRPARFVDEQVRGPFARFRHEHLFQVEGGQTLMIDRIEFAAPVGLIGILAERSVLTRYLRDLIRRRNAYLVSQVTER